MGKRNVPMGIDVSPMAAVLPAETTFSLSETVTVTL